MPLDRNRILNALFRDNQEPVVISSLDHKILDVNAAFHGVFGFVRGEAIGRGLADLCPDAQSAEAFVSAFVESDDTTPTQIVLPTYRRADGTVFDARTTVMAIRDESRAIRGFAAIIHALPDDVNRLIDSGRDLGQLMMEVRLYERLYRRSPAMLHSIDQNGVIRHVSQAWLSRFGYREEEVIGRRSIDFLTEDSREDAKAVLQDFWRTGRCDRVPYTFLTKDGQPVEIELSAILDTTDGVVTTLAILEDVTERNRAIREVNKRNDELRNFARVAAHDLQAPLRHISLFSKLIEDDLDTGNYADAHENALQIQRSVGRMRGMVQALLDFSLSTEKRVSPEPTDLNRLIANVRDAAATEIAKTCAQIRISDLPTVACDPVLFERVISNVFDNALKYVARGVTPSIRITAESTSQSVTLRIADNGIGIAEDFQERIFQPLKRLHGEDSEYPGFGIGLALCQKIVEAHFGRIWVEPNASGGSTFFIELPDPALVTEGDIDTLSEKAIGDR
ncbi:MAG: PAS domain S-box protein [Pseudomonadota bacterium]